MTRILPFLMCFIAALDEKIFTNLFLGLVCESPKIVHATFSLRSYRPKNCLGDATIIFLMNLI